MRQPAAADRRGCQRGNAAESGLGRTGVLHHPFDPDDHTYKVFTTGAGDNYTSYSNAAIDQILAAARHTEDAAEREKLYLEFQDKLTAHLPYTFIAYVDADYAMKANIHGITEDTVLGHHGVGVFWNIAQWSIA